MDQKEGADIFNNTAIATSSPPYEKFDNADVVAKLVKDFFAGADIANICSKVDQNVSTPDKITAASHFFENLPEIIAADSNAANLYNKALKVIYSFEKKCADASTSSYYEKSATLTDNPDYEEFAVMDIDPYDDDDEEEDIFVPSDALGNFVKSVVTVPASCFGAGTSKFSSTIFGRGVKRGVEVGDSNVVDGEENKHPEKRACKTISVAEDKDSSIGCCCNQVPCKWTVPRKPVPCKFVHKKPHFVPDHFGKGKASGDTEDGHKRKLKPIKLIIPQRSILAVPKIPDTVKKTSIEKEKVNDSLCNPSTSTPPQKIPLQKTIEKENLKDSDTDTASSCDELQ